MKKIDATFFLTNILGDAQLMLHDRQPERAVEHIKLKIAELEKYEKADYMKVDWR